jgi:transcriptional regulator GlxA family with amidase domain
MEGKNNRIGKTRFSIDDRQGRKAEKIVGVYRSAPATEGLFKLLNGICQVLANGRIDVWTSAGITAGIDLALALVEEDHGFAVAKGVAQHLVVYHRRHGGQSQFAASVDLAPKNDRIAAALGYARDHIAEVITVERLAKAVGMSLRQFSRAFRAQTGTTPARVVERLRADLARGRIETTAEPVERIAEAVGFGAAENMRRAFIRIYGRPPQSVRRAIRT